MEIKDLQGKLVAVLGYGLEGKATAAYLIKHGLNPVLFDEKPWAEWPPEEQEKIKALGLNFIFGPDAFLELKGFDVAFRSPGIKLSELTTYNLSLITSQTKWFFEHCPAKIIGVTGTKGKGTTSSLIYEILSVSLRGGGALADNEAILSSANKRSLRSDALARNDIRRVFLTGNIGATQPFEILDDLKSEDRVVYELSSFQLQDMDRSPHIGVVLMVTQEHLDYHKDINEYVEAKAAITKFQKPDDFAVVNADFENSMKIGKLGHGTKLFFSRQKVVTPGCYALGGNVIGIGTDGVKIDIARTDELGLLGSHNLENVCAAVCAAHAAGASMGAIRSAIRSFKGLEHRLELVAEKNGIKYYNDSFSTTPETAVAAIRSFSEPLIVILGGSTKHSDFSELGSTIASSNNLRALILIGEEGARIKKEVDAAGGTGARILEGAISMSEILTLARGAAQAGDVVLLSPACASFGMFKNYKDRGVQFKEQVNKL